MYKLIESAYKNGVEVYETQIYNDTDNYDIVKEWYDSINTKNELIDIRKSFDRYVDDYALSIEEYINGEWYRTCELKSSVITL